MQIWKIFLLVAGVAIILGAASYFFPYKKTQKTIWGVSFSPYYASYLGLDVEETFRVILDEWNFKYLRLTARWDEVEKERGKFDFSQVDYFMDSAAKRNAKVVLAMGQKTPRWPECNIPSWAGELSEQEYLEALNNYLSVTAKYYSKHPALEIWQVENEPFLEFGEKCRKITVDQLQSEIKTTKNSDPDHPILITDSGELSFWIKTLKAGDLFGTTVYRVVWNKLLGYVSYDWVPTSFYRWRAAAQGENPTGVFIAELQAEPWIPDEPITEDTIKTQLDIMGPEQIKKNLDFAEKTDFSRAYLWGAEWWYWLKLHGHPEISEHMKNLDKSEAID